MMTYEDFEVRISADGGCFEVEAQRGDQSATEHFELDPVRAWDLWSAGECDPPTARVLGATLFHALMQGSIRSLYDQAQGGASGDPKRGVRIRIRIDPRQTRLRPFLRLPWEILFDPLKGAGNHPGLDPRTPIVRTLDSAAETLFPLPDLPLRVLIALADPRNPITLDLEGERERIESALAPLEIRPEVLRQVTRSAFEQIIRDGGFHVVHFLGHGDWVDSKGEGVLILEKERRAPDPLPASIFAGFFVGRPMPRLVVLSACSSGDLGGSTGIGSYPGTAAALAAEGLPAVLAMQTAVRDRSAVCFSERLYSRLAAGDAIEEAVAEARKALKTQWPETLDWAVPALFVRGLAEGAHAHKGERSVPEVPSRGSIELTEFGLMFDDRHVGST